MAKTRKRRQHLRGTTRALALRDPRESLARVAPAPQVAPPVLLLNGFGTSAWVLGPLARHLERRLERPVLRPNLGGVLPFHVGDVRTTARRMQAQLDTWLAASGAPFADVVGHSLGGLVATYMLKVLDRGRHVRRVITLGTPHSGTWAALPGVLVCGLFSRAIWQMLPGSSLLRELHTLPVPRGSEWIALESDGDALVPPAWANDVPGVLQFRLAGLGHVEYLTSRAVFRAVAGALAA